ncbi:hypothetical protein LOTGIDRAFT_157951 [Lottia gigantea]|uniref:Uncharacterized protein n=1 Tax=Lottia gigantea TaxID=225164 RepID=V4A9J4_LOTGI|nr:hypothetical protein LOTGIDRAFT_157951 [Lottia gigantea]ESP00664.1 hypothetical protein LOTGIDRAFT_157951 [Lottia gigantea]
MAAFCKYFTVFIGKHSLNPSLLNFYGVQQVRHARSGVGNQLTIYPREPRKSQRKKVDRYPSNEAMDEKLVEDIMESEFSERIINLHENDLEPSKFKEQLKRDAIRNKERLKMQIIKRKYFKPEKEDNVLTWRAKEQIRYLHATSPEEWSISVLAGVFPVSIYGVSKILKSKFIEVSKNEIKKHDSRVVEKWREWSRNDVDDDRLSRIMCAAGVPDLPFRRKPTPKKLNHPTPFSDIFKRVVQPDRLLESGEKPQKSENTVNDFEVLAFYQTILEDLFPKNEGGKTNEKEYVTLEYQKDDSFDKIKVPSNQRSEGQVYQKGKTVYDEDGEFLYKIP